MTHPDYLARESVLSTNNQPDNYPIKVALIEKYDISGPRYTSYPTAIQFKPDFSSEKFHTALKQIGPAPISLYIHIPFCENICYYCACNKVITKDKAKALIYLDYLLKEARQIAAISGRLAIKQLHFGGGTPTFLSNQQLDYLMTELKSIFEFMPDAEISIEIDPRSIDEETLIRLKQLDFNRISIGVQDLDPDVQKAVNRIHSKESIQAVVEQARGQGFSSINMDLIYGLPLQTLKGFMQTLDAIIELAPDRLSVYNYAHLPHRFKPQRLIQVEQLPLSEEKIAILQGTINKLTHAGYQYIGMDHFALESNELSIAQKNGQLHRNFQGYSTQANLALLGLGVSSISQIDGIHCQNNPNLNSYYQAIDKGESAIVRGCQSSDDDRLRHDIIMGLLCDFSIDICAIEKIHQIEFNTYFIAENLELLEMQADGLLKIVDNQIEVTEQGRFFVRNICMVFDYYLRQAPPAINYSKVI